MYLNCCLGQRPVSRLLHILDALAGGGEAPVGSAAACTASEGPAPLKTLAEHTETLYGGSHKCRSSRKGAGSVIAAETYY
jgi:hypothetical protein